MPVSRKKTLEYLYGLERFGWKLDLHRIKILIQQLNDPQKQFESVHIAGTNGKGSTAAFLASILKESGLRTGLYTSPHLQCPEERIMVNGEIIDAEEFIGLIEEMRNAIDATRATFFEAMTAIAFSYFARRSVTIAVVETGLGGRFDATTILNPTLTVITDLSLDHVALLGTTIERIAFEKAGIIKPNIPCLTSVSEPSALATLRRIAQNRGAPLMLLRDLAHIENVQASGEGSTFSMRTPHRTYDKLTIPLLGPYQVRNGVLAAAAAEQLAVTRDQWEALNVTDGLAKVVWPGRLQKIREKPLVLVDVAHNPQALREVMETIARLFSYRNLIVVFGVLSDKDYCSMVKIAAEYAHTLVAITPPAQRALEAAKLCGICANMSLECVHGGDAVEGLMRAQELATLQDIILVTGSFYAVGAVLDALSLKNT